MVRDEDKKDDGELEDPLAEPVDAEIETEDDDEDDPLIAGDDVEEKDWM